MAKKPVRKNANGVNLILRYPDKELWEKFGEACEEYEASKNSMLVVLVNKFLREEGKIE